MSPTVRAMVRRRADDRCEYCGIHQHDQLLKFHVEHVRARQHGGLDDPSNLAWACIRCNLFKGPNLACVDPETQALAPLFNPREESWHKHFRLEGVIVCGITAIRRATVVLLRMNDDDRLRLRAALKPS